nr:hypothetical protein [uncultured Tolumonas sp.]
MMSPEQILSSAPPELIVRLLDKRQIRIRKRWAIIQLNLWLQQGWVTAQGEGIFLLTDAGEQTFRHFLLNQNERSLELLLQQLDIQLPAQCNSRILAYLLKQDPQTTQEQMREHDINVLRDSYLLLRCNLPCSIFMQSGELIDVSSLFSAWGEVAIPERAISAITKILWKEKPPQHVITIDNRDAFVSMALPADTLLIHAPLKDTTMAEQLLRALTDNIHWLHFGDLSPVSFQQANLFAERIQRQLALFLPENWSDYLRLLGEPLAANEKWSLAGLTRQQQISLQFLFENRQKLPQQVMVYAKNWIHLT